MDTIMATVTITVPMTTIMRARIITITSMAIMTTAAIDIITTNEMSIIFLFGKIQGILFDEGHELLLRMDI